MNLFYSFKSPIQSNSRYCCSGADNKMTSAPTLLKASISSNDKISLTPSFVPNACILPVAMITFSYTAFRISWIAWIIPSFVTCFPGFYVINIKSTPSSIAFLPFSAVAAHPLCPRNRLWIPFYWFNSWFKINTNRSTNQFFYVSTHLITLGIFQSSSRGILVHWITNHFSSSDTGLYYIILDLIQDWFAVSVVESPFEFRIV